MKNQYTLPFLFILLSVSLAQSQISETISPNNASATFRADGAMFTDEVFTENGFMSPFEFGQDHPSQIYFSNLIWTGISRGLDEEVKGKLPEQIYRNFRSGPVVDNLSRPADGADTLYNRVWQVYGEDILSLISDYNDNNQIDLQVGRRLLLWPGRNNPHVFSLLGFEIPDQDLAPFFDRNLDDIYDPMDGDYPIIDDAYPDVIASVLTFSVYNDYAIQDFPHEYHLMTFGFRCEEESGEINNTIFTKNTFINKSNQDYRDVNAGLVIDYDLGCPDDDFIGCAPGLNSAYVYNEDEVDGINGTDCVIGGTMLESFRDNPGTVSSTILNHAMTSSVRRNRTSMVDQFDQQHYNLNGVQASVDQNGNLILDTVNYLFPDFPTEPNGDHAVNAGLATTDWFTIMGSYIGDVSIGQRVDLFHAWYANADETRTAHQEPDVLKTAIPVIQQFFDDGFANSCTQILDICDDDCVWPGDVNRDDRVFHDDFIIARYGINQGLSGPERVYESSRFTSFNGMDWATPIPAISNAKHIDCYGDGEANLIDRLVVQDNYGKETPAALPVTPVLPETSTQGIKFNLFKNRFEENRPFIFRTFALGRLFVSINPDVTATLSGISFSIYFDETYIDTESIRFELYPEAIIDTDNDEESIIAYIADEKRIDIAISSTSTSALESELLVPIMGRWAIDADLRIPAGQDRLFIPFPIHDLRAIDTDGNMVDIGFIQDSMWLDKLTLQLMHDVPFAALELFNSNGKIVRSQAIDSDKLSMSISDLPNGIYMLHVKTKNGNRAIKKVVVMN